MATISERIDKVLLRDQNKDAANKYLEVIRGNLRECVATFDRRIWSLIVTVVALELMAQALVSEFSFAGLKLGNLTFIQKILPAVVAYLYYSLVTIIAYRRLLEEVHDAMMRRLLPDFYDNNLEFYAYPPTAFLLERIICYETKGWFASILDTMIIPLQLVIIIGPAVYLAYSQWRAFSLFGPKDPLIWISLSVMLLFVVQVFLLIAGINRLTKLGKGRGRQR